MNAIISEYLNYIKKLCGFAARTVTRHKRICGIWKAFLNSKARRIIDVAPQDLLAFIEYRSRQVKRSTLVGELCVIRSRMLTFMILIKQIRIWQLPCRNSSANPRTKLHG